MKPTSKRKYKRYEPRQEISKILKYFIFAVNFVFVICSITFIALGLYLYLDDVRPIAEIGDIFLNAGIVFALVGLIVFVVSLMACIGSLRENVCLLKSFALCIFFCYIMLVVSAFLLFILFYSDSSDGISIQSLLLSALTKYHINNNYRDFIDYIQEQLNCCGVTSQGYKDWDKNGQFNCSEFNLVPERCGVPSTCCRRPFVYNSSTSGGPEAVLSAMKSYQCWQNAQEKSHTELEPLIHVVGCLNPVRQVFERKAVTIGAVIGGLVIPVCFSVMLANILAKQIERQYYLLAKEARRDAKKRRRSRQKFRDPYAISYAPPDRTNGTKTAENVDNIDETVAASSRPVTKKRNPGRKRSRPQSKPKDSVDSPARKKSSAELVPPPRRKRSAAERARRAEKRKSIASEPVYEQPKHISTDPERRSCSDLSQI